MKYLGINLIKVVIDLHAKNYKALIKINTNSPSLVQLLLVSSPLVSQPLLPLLSSP